MAATAVERCARGLGARVDDAARTAVGRGGARAPASLCLAVLRGRGEEEALTEVEKQAAWTMDLNLEDDGEAGGDSAE